MNIIGIDAGASWIKAGRFSPNFKLLQETKVASGASQGKEEYFASIKEALEKVGGGSFALGIGLPGMFSKDGQHLLYTAHVAGLSIKDPSTSLAQIKQHLGIEKIVAANDAKCAAWAEWKQGVGQANINIRLLHITWGTGIGTGLIVNGKFQYGWEGGQMLTAGRVELEHSKDISDFVWALANLAVIGYPDIVTLGGGLATPDLLDQIKQYVSYLPAGFAQRALPPDIIQLGKLGNHAGMIGAAMLAGGGIINAI